MEFYMKPENFYLVLIIIMSFYAQPTFALILTSPVKVGDAHVKLNHSSSDKLNPESIKVFVWNIYKGGKKGFKEDFIEYGSDRDIFMVQEMLEKDVVMSAIAELPHIRFDVGISFKYRFKKGRPYSGTMIGSRVKPSYIALSRSQNKEPIALTYKVLTIGKYPIENHEDLLIINIHGMNITNNKAFYRQIDDAINTMINHKGPIIFAGDFNTNRQKRIDYLQRNLVERLGFINMEFRNDERMKSAITNLTIDLSFIRGLTIIDAEVLKDLDSSDHKAMYFEVKVKDKIN